MHYGLRVNRVLLILDRYFLVHTQLFIVRRPSYQVIDALFHAQAPLKLFRILALNEWRDSKSVLECEHRTNLVSIFDIARGKAYGARKHMFTS